MVALGLPRVTSGGHDLAHAPKQALFARRSCDDM
jgi:hypothetical protein